MTVFCFPGAEMMHPDFVFNKESHPGRHSTPSRVTLTAAQRSRSLPEQEQLNLPTLGLWDEKDWRAPVVGNSAASRHLSVPIWLSALMGSGNGETLAQITRADQGPSDWSIVFSHLSIKDEFLMEREGERRVGPLPRSSMKRRRKPWVTHLLCLCQPASAVWKQTGEKEKRRAPLFLFFCPFLSPPFIASLVCVWRSLCHTPTQTHTCIQYW